MQSLAKKCFMKINLFFFHVCAKNKLQQAFQQALRNIIEFIIKNLYIYFAICFPMFHKQNHPHKKKKNHITKIVTRYLYGDINGDTIFTMFVKNIVKYKGLHMKYIATVPVC
jgi:hypothetical protein